MTSLIISVERVNQFNCYIIIRGETRRVNDNRFSLCHFISLMLTVIFDFDDIDFYNN